ncbi:MAG: 4Fe-4S single cluster domain-containing protein [Monoglobaceae bacterium]
MLCIARMYYPVTTLGPGNRLGIWFAGCKKHCKGCVSPELRYESSGRKMSVSDIMNLINSINAVPDGITISGGEPFLHPKSLLELVIELEKLTEDIIIFTGFRHEELLDDSHSAEVLKHIAVLIDGEYIQELNNEIGLRGSSNQRILRFRQSPKYDGLEACKRSLQNVVYGDNLLIIGIP